MERVSNKSEKISGKQLFVFPQSSLKLTLMFSLPFTLVFVILIAALMFWERKSHDNDLIAELREAARAYFEQVVLMRLWNAGRGGVYVEVTESTQPNPYLKDDPQRDIVTIDGRKFTKINPAYMTRQISELAYQKGRYKFHITSLRPVNPNNIPDEWERRQLQLFEEGKKTEAYEVVKERGVFRYMSPLITEAACLTCHQKHGYETGDIRGGISIDIPTELPSKIHTAKAKRSIIAFGVIGMTAVSFIVVITWLFSKRIISGIQKEMEHEKLKTAIQLAGAAAHELRQPMTIIIGVAELLDDKISKNESVNHDIDIIAQQCYRMDEIIKKMLKITTYKTKTYTDDTEIFDLEGQAEKTDSEHQ